MKKTAVLILGLVCAGSLVVNAQEAKTNTTTKPVTTTKTVASKKAQPAFTAEQKAIQKELLEKFDTNKDGKLDKTEKAKMSKEDKSRWTKANIMTKSVKAPSTTKSPKTEKETLVKAAPAKSATPSTESTNAAPSVRLVLRLPQSSPRRFRPSRRCPAPPINWECVRVFCQGGGCPPL